MINLPFSVGAMLDREMAQLNYEHRRDLFEKVALLILQGTNDTQKDTETAEYFKKRVIAQLNESATFWANAILKASDEFAKEAGE